MGGAYLVTWTVLCFHCVTFKQLLNCVFLFTIYAPESPAPLPKLRLTRVRMREFSQPEGNRDFKLFYNSFVENVLTLSFIFWFY